MWAFEAIFYDKPDGTEPTKGSLDGLGIKMRAKTLWTIDMLQSGGMELREPYSKHPADGI